MVLFQLSRAYDYFPLDVLLKYMLGKKRRAEVAVASTMQLLEIFVSATARFPSRTTTQEWLMGSITGGRRCDTSRSRGCSICLKEDQASSQGPRYVVSPGSIFRPTADVSSHSGLFSRDSVPACEQLHCKPEYYSTGRGGVIV